MAGDLLEDLLNAEEKKSIIEEEDAKLAPLLDQINMIMNADIRSFVRAILFNVDTFWIAPPTNIEYFHPFDEMKLGGGVIHTQRVVRIARLLCRSQERNEHELDVVTAAALLHDVTKAVDLNGSFTYDSMHPYTVDHFVSVIMHHDLKKDEYIHSSPRLIDEKDYMVILRLIRCHMGPWSPIPETYPVSQLDWILHFADILATQLHVVIDGEDIKEWRWVEPGEEFRSEIPQEDVPIN